MSLIQRLRDKGYIPEREWLSKKFFDSLFQMLFIGIMATVISTSILRYLLP